MTPCAVGTGLETVWKVSEWTVFTSLVAGAWSITIASAGLMLFYKYLDDPRCEGAHMAVGLFLGCSFSSVLVMLDQFGVWSAEWDLMGALSTVSHRNEIFYNNGNHMHLSNGLLPQFKANAVLAFLAVMIQAAIIGQIAIGQGALTEALVAALRGLSALWLVHAYVGTVGPKHEVRPPPAFASPP